MELRSEPACCVDATWFNGKLAAVTTRDADITQRCDIAVRIFSIAWRGGFAQWSRLHRRADEALARGAGDGESGPRRPATTAGPAKHDGWGANALLSCCDLTKE
jgi:hypothetical protein